MDFSLLSEGDSEHLKLNKREFFTHFKEWSFYQIRTYLGIYFFKLTEHGWIYIIEVIKISWLFNNSFCFGCRGNNSSSFHSIELARQRFRDLNLPKSIVNFDWIELEIKKLRCFLLNWFVSAKTKNYLIFLMRQSEAYILANEKCQSKFSFFGSRL